MSEPSISIRQLSSGWWHIRETVNDWAQVPAWPADEATIRMHAFDQASDGFIQRAVATAFTEAGQS